MRKQKSTKQKTANGKRAKKKEDMKKNAAQRGSKKMPGALGSKAGPTQVEAVVKLGIGAPMVLTEVAHEEAHMTSSQCIVWRLGEFRARVRRAVAEWAQDAEVSPTNTLSELAKGTPWNTGQMAQLVQSVNANKVFDPHFPGTVMQPPAQLASGSTTVLQWEAIVWKHQSPLTSCFAFTD